MNKSTKILILDDDTDASELMRYRLNKSLDAIEIEVRSTPDASGEFDVYFVDNDFDGCRLGPQLTRQIRGNQPESLIFAFSANLDSDTLKHLMNVGCDGVCEKHDPDELQSFLSIVGSRIQERRFRSSRNADESGFLATVRSITELIREWNRRLENNIANRQSEPAMTGVQPSDRL